jgi:hypothetical protein
MTCAFADWSQRRFPVESGRTAAVSSTLVRKIKDVAKIIDEAKSGTRPESQAISRSRTQLS